MSLDALLPILRTDRWAVFGIGVALGLLFWVARWIRSIVISGRPDDALSSLGMLIGFGWSSEAVWLLTGPGGADLITPIRWALFAIFEVILLVFMIRASRNMRLIGRPGRAGRNAWIVATGMSLVAVTIAHNLGEAFLRILVPLLLTAMWWDGLVGETFKRLAGTSSWRWTPRRFLLWIGAIEPGERDIETVHRERLTQQMVNCEFRRRHGKPGQQKRAARRLSRLSLVADDAVIADVRARVDRARWFEARPSEASAVGSAPAVPASSAASARAAKVRHGRRVRTLRVTHPVKVITAAPEPRQDERATHEVDLVVRAIKDTNPGLSRRQIARLAATSEATTRRALRRTEDAEPTQINGHKPDLKGVNA